MRAAWLAALAGALIALACPVGSGRAAAPEPVEVRAATHPGFGRLVLEWPAPVAVDGRQQGDRLTLRFTRPFTADLDAVPGALGDYLVALARAADGRAVTLSLVPGTAASLNVDDDRIVIVDLTRGGAEGARQSGPIAVGPGSQAGVALRTGVHDGFLRIVLDWARPIDFATEADGRRLRLRFERVAPIDAALIRARCRALLDDASASEADGRSELRLALKAGVRAEVFKVEGRQVVVDLYEPARAPPAHAAPRLIPALAPEAPPSTGLPEPAAAPPEPAAAPLALELRAAEVEGGDALEFVWNRPVGAAFLLRAGYLWSVFAPLSSPSGTLLSPLESPVPAWLGPGERVEAEGGIALRFALRRPLAARVERAGDRWRVLLGASAAPPAAARIERRSDSLRLRIVTGEAARLVRATDPEVGDRLTFWPLLAPGLGQPRPQRLVEIELLATAQGLAWRAQVDRLRAEPVDGAVELVAPEGLRRSAASAPPADTSEPPADPQVRAPPETPEPEGPPAEVAGRASERDGRPPHRGAESAVPAPDSTPPAEPDRPPPVAEERPAAAPAVPAAGAGSLDLARFAPASRDSLADGRVLLERRILNAAAEDRPAARLELTRFLVAHGLAAEALAMLEIMGAPDGAAAHGPLQRARLGLTGAAQLLMGRSGESAAALEAPALDADPEVALWRAALAAARSDWPRAAEELARSERILDGYPEPLQFRLGLPAVRIAIEAGNQDAATRLLGRLKALKLAPVQRARVEFLDGLAQARRGAIDEADRIWSALEGRRNDDATRIDAGFARVQMLLGAGRLTPAEALKRLAAARSLWRPHPREHAMLDGLARLYLRTGDPAGALRTWHDVLTHFPDQPEAEQVAKAMRAAFVTALLPEDGAGIGALRAYALYRDFPDLMPEGELGDRLRRRLAAGLAGLDLIEPAAALLEPLIAQRLRGSARAEAGAYLAELWLREPNPDAALAALDRSQVEGGLPPALGVQRRVLRARALAAQGRPDAALALLADGADPAQQRLRAEILWQQRDWPRLIGALEDLLRTRADPDEPLANAEQDLVIKLAIADARRGDADALQRLRARFGEVMRGQAGEPAFLMATLSPVREVEPEAPLAAADEHLERVRGYLDTIRAAR